MLEDSNHSTKQSGSTAWTCASWLSSTDIFSTLAAEALLGPLTEEMDKSAATRHSMGYAELPFLRSLSKLAEEAGNNSVRSIHVAISP